MNFLSLVFYIFILTFLLVYYITPRKYRYIVITIGSYIFYGYTNMKMLLILIVITGITYLGGIFIEKKSEKNVKINKSP